MTRPRSARPESSVERYFLRQPLQLATLPSAALLPSTTLPSTTVELDGPEAHHLLHVLRAKVGDHLGLFNGNGDEALAEIANIRKRSAELLISETWSVPSEPSTLTIATAMPKGDRARWLIEKSTELGVTRIIPLRTQRSIVEPGETKMDKLEQAVITACKQCGRSHLMQINSLTPFTNLLRELPPVTLIAHPSVPQSVSQAFAQSREQSALMLIGPEGGFSDEEFAAAVTAGAIPVHLGPHILRIETAAIAVAAAWRLKM